MLSIACELDFDKVFEFLLEKGANVNGGSYTALMIAAFEGDTRFTYLNS